MLRQSFSFLFSRFSFRFFVVVVVVVVVVGSDVVCCDCVWFLPTPTPVCVCAFFNWLVLFGQMNRGQFSVETGVRVYLSVNLCVS